MPGWSKRAPLLLMMVVALLTPPPAEAQSTDGEIEEITVTARRRTESLQDVPIAITAFSGEELNTRGLSDITELAQIAPSVTIEPTRATNTTLTAFIRGVGQQDPLAGFEPGVAVYLDDVYFARPQSALLSIYDVERIEVLRGPQGTLYGRNALGGAIKYVTRQLGEEPEARLRLAYGSETQRDAVLTASLPLGETLRVGATLASLNRDGFGKNLTTGDEHYNKTVLGVRVSAEWSPSETVFVRLAADFTDDKSNPVAGHRPYPGAVSGTPVTDLYNTYAGATRDESTRGIGGRNDIDADGFQVSVEWEASERLTFKSITAYRSDYTETVIDFDSLEINDFDAPVIYDNKQFSQELQFHWSGDRSEGVFGFYYLEVEASNDFDVVLGTLVGGAGVTAYTGGVVETEAWSVFADWTYDFAEKFSLSLGGRYTNDTRKADIFRANYLGIGSPFFIASDAAPLAVTSDFERERTFTDFAPRVALDYALSDDLTLYASYSNGFRAGSFDPRGASVDNSEPGVENGFEPETLDSYEAGLKATWPTSPLGYLRTNLAVFFSDYADMQIAGSLAIDTDDDGVNDDFVGTVTNAGGAEIAGIEFEGTALLTDALTLQVTLNALDAKITEWIVDGVNVASMREIQNTPESMAYIGLHYEQPLARGTLHWSANWSYKDDIVQFETPVPEIDQDAYSIWNASIVWHAASERWTLGLHGKNLSDTNYRTAGYNFPTLGMENNVTAFYGPPRTFTLAVDIFF